MNISSQKLKMLKEENRQNGDFDLMRQRLIESGIFNKSLPNKKPVAAKKAVCKKAEKITGKLTIFKDVKGFGFILADKQAYYLHITNYIGNERPQVGDVLSFESEKPTDGKGNPMAINARKVNANILQ